MLSPAAPASHCSLPCRRRVVSRRSVRQETARAHRARTQMKRASLICHASPAVNAGRDKLVDTRCIWLRSCHHVAPQIHHATQNARRDTARSAAFHPQRASEMSLPRRSTQRAYAHRPRTSPRSCKIAVETRSRGRGEGQGAREYGAGGRNYAETERQRG